MLEAYVSGICAATASLMGKLSGREGISIYFRGIFFIFMIICNGLVWSLYVKALNKSNDSLKPTVISAASNFVSSAFMGILFFGETTSFVWWTGAILIIGGLALISKSNL